jgi:hypothetical protein
MQCSLPISERSLEPSPSKADFLGYELAGYNYRVYYPETNEVKTHRDVDFNEAALFPGMKQQHPSHIIKVGELEHYDNLAELPPRRSLALGTSRLDMFSSDEEDDVIEQIETDFPLPPIPDDEEATMDEAELLSQQEPGNAPSHVNTSEYSPSSGSLSGSESNQSSPIVSPTRTAPVPSPTTAPTTRTTRIPRGQAPVNYREPTCHSARTPILEPKTYKEAMNGPEAKH